MLDAYHPGIKAKACGGVPTEAAMPRLVLRVERVTLPRVTPIGGGAQSMAAENENNEKITSVRNTKCRQTLARWADISASTKQQ